MAHAGDERDRSKVQSVERALDLLTVLARYGHAGAHISELSAVCGLKLSTCHRLLATLVKKGFVERHRHKNTYCIGESATALGKAVISSDEIDRLREVVRPIMSELSAATSETINAAILDGRDVMYIDQVEATAMPKASMFARKGNRGPAYCTGSGKALLAGLGEAEVERLLKGIAFEKFTSETIDDMDKLRLELAKIRSDGYALDMGERDVDVRCVAAPVFDSQGRTVCAISIAGPSSRLSNFRLQHELIGLVCDAAKKATENLVKLGVKTY